MAVKAEKLVSGVEVAYNEKWGYIWGQSGAVWTEKKQKDLEAKYNSNPSKYSDYKLAAECGRKWIGKKVTDCSGLPYSVLKALGIKIYHGSNSIWRNNLSHKGKITAGMKLPLGAAIFTGTENEHGHIGTLTSSTCVTEAHGTIKGVIHTPLSNKKWTYWGLYKGVTYDFIPGKENSKKKDNVDKQKKEEKPVVKHTTLRKGAKGEEVALMQTLLAKHGSTLEIDGIFGNGTLAAVKAFQRKNSLVVDGIVGPKTWAKLEE